MTFDSTPPPSLGLGRSLAQLPVRAAKHLLALVKTPLHLLPGKPAAPARRADATILPSELPIPSYDALAAGDAAEAIRGLPSTDDVALMLAYERANAKRPDVIRAAMAAR